MNKKVTCLVAIFIATSLTPLSAARPVYLVDSDENHYGNEQSVCANLPLEVVNDDRDSEVLILDGMTKEILDVYNLTKQAPYVMFPTNAGDITLVLNKYTENEKIDSSEQQSINLKVVDCGQQTKSVQNHITGLMEEKIIPAIDEYERTNYASTYEYDGTTLKITKANNVEDYKIEYQFVTENKIYAKKLKFRNKETEEIKNSEYNIIQVNETYVNQSGNDVANYFEIELNPANKTYTIRNIAEFSPRAIDRMALIDFPVVIWLVFLGLFYLPVNLAYRRQRRRYRRHKIRLMQRKRNETKK